MTLTLVAARHRRERARRAAGDLTRREHFALESLVEGVDGWAQPRRTWALLAELEAARLIEYRALAWHLTAIGRRVLGRAEQETRTMEAQA
jgi:hypothetical protein